jgi:hypothetical protein
MSCVRCGKCCSYLVAVVAPKHINKTNLNLSELHEEDDFICCNGTENMRCPYLCWDDEKDVAVCTIHDKEWFNQTPCYRHNNPACGDLFACRIGPYIRSHKILLDDIREQIKQK